MGVVRCVHVARSDPLTAALPSEHAPETMELGASCALLCELQGALSIMATRPPAGPQLLARPAAGANTTPSRSAKSAAQFGPNSVVGNVAACYAAFDVKRSDRLLPAPAERVRIW